MCQNTGIHTPYLYMYLVWWIITVMWQILVNRKLVSNENTFGLVTCKWRNLQWRNISVNTVHVYQFGSMSLLRQSSTYQTQGIMRFSSKWLCIAYKRVRKKVWINSIVFWNMLEWEPKCVWIKNQKRSNEIPNVFKREPKHVCSVSEMHSNETLNSFLQYLKHVWMKSWSCSLSVSKALEQGISWVGTRAFMHSQWQTLPIRLSLFRVQKAFALYLVSERYWRTCLN